MTDRTDAPQEAQFSAPSGPRNQADDLQRAAAEASSAIRNAPDRMTAEGLLRNYAEAARHARAPRRIRSMERSALRANRLAASWSQTHQAQVRQIHTLHRRLRWARLIPGLRKALREEIAKREGIARQAFKETLWWRNEAKRLRQEVQKRHQQRQALQRARAARRAAQEAFHARWENQQAPQRQEQQRQQQEQQQQQRQQQRQTYVRVR